MATVSADVRLITKQHSYAVRLAKSYEYCALVAKQCGTNFYYAMLLTPKRKRMAMFAIYAWMRMIDDIADSKESNKRKLKKLLTFYRDTKKVLVPELDRASLPKGRHWLAFRETILDFKIPTQHLRDMLSGQIQTIRQQHYKTFNDLYKYCYRVASTVGLICVSIWGYNGGNETLKLAEYRGIALQLTNILRDVYQDAEEGYLYIPEEFFNEGETVTPEQILQDKPKKLGQAIDAVIAKASYYYQRSEQLEEFVARDGSLCLMVMTEIYHTIFNKIRHKPQLAVSKVKASINVFTKLYICLASSLCLLIPGLRHHYD